MAIRQRDFLTRQIEQLAEMVASLLGGKADVTTTQAARECERVRGTLLGPLRDGFDLLTPDSAILLLGGVEKTRLIARVLELEAEIHEQQGDAKAAATARRRALALLDAIAHKQPGAVGDAHRKTVAEIAAKLPR